MNCQELTDSISNIRAQLIELDNFVSARQPAEAINIKNDIIKQFNGELKEYIDTFYKNPTPENYDKEVNRIINKIGERDPSDVTFSRRQLRFIYDIDNKAKFSNFNPESVTKIVEIRKKRKSKQNEDAPIIFNLASDQIAWAEKNINQNTKAYIGPLFTGIFNLPNLEHIYTSFPKGEIKRSEFVTCGKEGNRLLKDLKARGISISDDSKEMLQSAELFVHNPGKIIYTIRLRVFDLFPDGRAHTYSSEIVSRAKELGLDNNLPHETAANLLLNESTQPKRGVVYTVASKTITDRNHNSKVFRLGRDDDGFYLSSDWTDPRDKWGADRELVFSLRPKPEQSSV